MGVYNAIERTMIIRSTRTGTWRDLEKLLMGRSANSVIKLKQQLHLATQKWIFDGSKHKLCPSPVLLVLLGVELGSPHSLDRMSEKDMVIKDAH